jgi:hypothetical protein
VKIISTHAVGPESIVVISGEEPRVRAHGGEKITDMVGLETERQHTGGVNQVINPRRRFNRETADEPESIGRFVPLVLRNGAKSGVAGLAVAPEVRKWGARERAQHSTRLHLINQVSANLQTHSLRKRHIPGLDTLATITGESRRSSSRGGGGHS